MINIPVRVGMDTCYAEITAEIARQIVALARVEPITSGALEATCKQSVQVAPVDAGPARNRTVEYADQPPADDAIEGVLVINGVSWVPLADMREVRADVCNAKRALREQADAHAKRTCYLHNQITALREERDDALTAAEDVRAVWANLRLECGKLKERIKLRELQRDGWASR